MYLYKKSMLSSFKFPFDGIENVDQSYSQLLQDMFVLAVTNGKREGTFLEVGADQPVFISNSFLLERQFGWKGISVDINPQSYYAFTSFGRKSKFILEDATKIDYHKVLNETFPGSRLDYCQIDCEPNTNSLLALKRVMESGYRFSVSTLEHDHYDTAMSNESNDFVRSEMSRLMTENGYIQAVANVSNLDYDHEMESWWIDGEFFPKKWIDKFVNYSDIVIPAHIYMGLP